MNDSSGVSDGLCRLHSSCENSRLVNTQSETLSRTPQSHFIHHKNCLQTSQYKAHVFASLSDGSLSAARSPRVSVLDIRVLRGLGRGLQVHLGGTNKTSVRGHADLPGFCGSNCRCPLRALGDACSWLRWHIS